MTVKRLNPLNASCSGKSKVTANNNSIEAIDQCPAPNCNTPMRLLNCNGIPSFVCLIHRIALPAQDV